MRFKTFILIMLFSLVCAVCFSYDTSEIPLTGSFKIDILDLKQVEILDVLKLISQKTGLNIIASKNVTGKVSVYLKDIDVIEALNIILDSYGWAYESKGNIIKIMTNSEYEERFNCKFGKEMQTHITQLNFVNPSNIIQNLNEMKSKLGKIIYDDKTGTIVLIDEPDKLKNMKEFIAKIDVDLKTQIFNINYADSEELADKITEILTPQTGKIKFDRRSNKVIVTDITRKMERIKTIIEEFDEKQSEVLIEAKIIQVILSDEYKFGVDWEGIISGYHNLNFSGDFGILSAADKKGKIGIGTLSSDKYTAMIEALETIGKTNILSSPRIMAINNKEAKILVGSTEPYVTTTTTTPSSGPTTTAESVNFIEVGVKLFVTPTIHNDGFITMKIKPEVSSVVENITTSSNNSIPVVDTSEAETTVIVKDNTTIVIGGLIKEESITSTKMVPLLGKVPFLGAAFRSKSNFATKTEIAIFLTPKIMSGEGY